MPDKNEKARRKKIMDDLTAKNEEAWLQSLPIPYPMLKDLFDFLDAELEVEGCDHTTALTETFLQQNKVENIPVVLEWLAEHGGACDCEVLANVEPDD